MQSCLGPVQLYALCYAARMKIQEASQFLLDRAKAHKADGAEVTTHHSLQQEVNVHNGNPEQTEQSESLGLSLRLVHDGRQVTVDTSLLTKEALETLFDKAWTMLPATPQVPDLVLTSPDIWHQPTAAELAALDLNDTTPLPCLPALFEEAKALEELCRADKRITNSEGVWATAGQSDLLLQTLNGFELSYKASLFSRGAALIAGEKDGMVVGYDGSTKRHRGDLDDLKTIAAKAIDKTTRKLGQRHIKSGKFPVIFEDDVAASLLGHLLGAINGRSVVLGTTFLKDSLNSKIFGDHITITEDPTRKRGFGSQIVDDEGILSQKRNIIDQGQLTTWVLDLRTASKLNMAPTGHASRSGALPHPQTTNVVMQPGTKTPQELMKEIGTGLFVTSLQGNSVNGVTGDYSRGCEGFWIENGELAYPVKEVTIAATLQEMFKTLIPASDLKIEGAVDTPSILVPKMDVSGK